MSRFICILIVVLTVPLCAVPLVHPAAAQTMEAFLRASAWQLEYEVSFSARAEGSSPVDAGTSTYSVSLENTLKGSLALDLRNDGSNLGMLKMVTAGAGASTSGPQQQKAMMDMVMHADEVANWISGGPAIDDDASDEVQHAAMLDFMQSGTAKLEYTLVETGTDLVDETGSTYDQVMRRTASGSGPVMPPTQLTFEVNAAAKHYLLTLPITFGDVSSSDVKEVTTDRITSKGEEPRETTNTREYGLASFPSSIVIDDPTALLGDIPLMEGTLDPSLGNVSGEKAVPAHYDDGGRTVSGTVTFRYKLTPR